MKILVISDTHSCIDYAIRALEKEKCDWCIHLGDIARDCEDLESIFPRQKFIFVKGNNDFWVSHWRIIRTRLKISIFGSFRLVVLERRQPSFVLRT